MQTVSRLNKKDRQFKIVLSCIHLGKGENIWDFITNENPDFVIDGSNGQVAADSYHKTNLDVQLLKNMSVDFYRFSISWSRILPKGHIYNVNDLGVNYYNNLIDELLANDIIPFVTIYHWDLPVPLHQIGGWPNPALIDIYGDYADLLFRLFGDRVKNWITFNEPFQICEEGYSLGTMAPGFKQLGIGGYQCAHTLLRAHARAYRIYEQRYKATQNGRLRKDINRIDKRGNYLKSDQEIQLERVVVIDRHGLIDYFF